MWVSTCSCQRSVYVPVTRGKGKVRKGRGQPAGRGVASRPLCCAVLCPTSQGAVVGTVYMTGLCCAPVGAWCVVFWCVGCLWFHVVYRGVVVVVCVTVYRGAAAWEVGAGQGQGPAPRLQLPVGSSQLDPGAVVCLCVSPTVVVWWRTNVWWMQCGFVHRRLRCGRAGAPATRPASLLLLLLPGTLFGSTQCTLRPQQLLRTPTSVVLHERMAAGLGHPPHKQLQWSHRGGSSRCRRIAQCSSFAHSFAGSRGSAAIQGMQQSKASAAAGAVMIMSVMASVLRSCCLPT